MHRKTWTMPRLSETEVNKVRKLRIKLLNCLKELKDTPPKLYAIKYSIDIMGIYFSLQSYRKKTAVVTSPIANAIELNFISLDREVISLKRAMGRMKLDSILGHLWKIVEQIRTLLVGQISLIYCHPVEDMWSGYPDDSPWPCFRGSSLNRGQARFQPQSPPEDPEIGRHYFGPVIWATPVIDGEGDFYAGHGESEYVAWGADGEKWRVGDPQMMYIDSTGALGKDGGLYMASTDMNPEGIQNQGRIWRLDPATGETKWQFWGRHFEDLTKNEKAHLSSFFEGHMSLNEEEGKIYIYAGNDDNRLYKVDAQGELVWEYFTDCYPAGVIWTKPVLSPTRDTVYIGTLAGEFHAVSTRDGTCRWKKRLGGAVVSSPAIGIGGELIFGCFDGKIYCIDARDGEIYWDYQTLGLIYSSPAIYPTGDLVIGSTDGTVYCLDRFGQKNWSYRTDGPIKSSPALDLEGNAYLGNERGKIYCISPQGRRVWSYLTNDNQEENDINGSPSIGLDGTVYLGSTDGNIYSIPQNYWYRNPQDPDLDLAPHHDGDAPPLLPGQARMILCDRTGNTTFAEVVDHYPTEPLLAKLLAADLEGDLVEATLVEDSIEVEIQPPWKGQTTFDGKGQYALIVGDEPLEPATEYTVSFRGKYQVGGETQSLDSSVTFTTASQAASSLTISAGPHASKEEEKPVEETTPYEFPLSQTDDQVEAMVLTGLVMSQPKELDNLGQAALSALHFGLTPVYLDEDRGVIALALACLALRGGNMEYVPGSLNKAVLTGRIHRGHFRVHGAMRLVAQGANIPVPKLSVNGYFKDRETVERGNVVGFTGLEDMPEFAELMKIMKLANGQGQAMGVINYRSNSLEGEYLSRPQGMTVEWNRQGGQLVAKFTGELPTKDHWVELTLFHRETGEAVGTSSQRWKKNQLESMAIDCPQSADKLVAVVVVDLFPLARWTGE